MGTKVSTEKTSSGPGVSPGRCIRLQKPAIEVLCIHAAKTLPDSLGNRRDVLAALSRALRFDHPAHRDVQAQLAAIDAVETLDHQLQTRFESPENKSNHRPSHRREGKP